MTLQHGYYATDGGDRFDVAFRLQQLIKGKGISAQRLAEIAAVSRGEIERILGDHFESIDEIRLSIQRIAMALDVDENYLISGTIDSHSCSIKDKRIKLSRAVEKFCDGMDMERRVARFFFIWMMNRCEPLFQKQAIGVHCEQVPETRLEVQNYYLEWTNNGKRKV